MALYAVVGTGADENIVAVARYSGNPAYCEFAIAVAEEWRSRGIGTKLCELLFEYAKTHGVRRMFAVLRTGNDRMLKLATDLSMRIRMLPNDNMAVEAWRTL